MTDLNEEQVLGRLAEQIHSPTPDTNQIPNAFLRFASIVSADFGFRYTIKFAGDNNISNVRYIDAVGGSLSAGVTVAVLQYRVEGEQVAYLIIGKVA